MAVNGSSVWSAMAMDHSRHERPPRDRATFPVTGGDVMVAVEPLPDAVLKSRRLRGRLGALLLECSEEELQVLEASVEGRYEAVASGLGIAVQTARNKACLLRRRLRAELLD